MKVSLFLDEDLAIVVGQQSMEVDGCDDPDGKIDCVPLRHGKIEYAPLRVSVLLFWFSCIYTLIDNKWLHSEHHF
jgi:hypothetical protein